MDAARGWEWTGVPADVGLRRLYVGSFGIKLRLP